MGMTQRSGLLVENRSGSVTLELPKVTNEGQRKIVINVRGVHVYCVYGTTFPSIDISEKIAKNIYGGKGWFLFAALIPVPRDRYWLWHALLWFFWALKTID